MHAIRNAAFMLLLTSWVIARSGVPLDASTASCDPPAYPEWYTAVSDDGTCEGANVEADCINSCSECFETEDWGDVEECWTYEYTGGGYYYIAACWCGAGR
jgi:hypothetical protein